jgi:hypothetical protein
MSLVKSQKYTSILLIIFLYAETLQAVTFGLGRGVSSIGSFYLIAQRDGMVFYADKASITISPHQTIAATYLVQHEASTDETRSMVNHVQVNCIARTIRKIKVTHWTGNWGDGRLVTTEELSSDQKPVGTRGIQSKLVSFICASVSLT